MLINIYKLHNCLKISIFNSRYSVLASLYSAVNEFGIFFDVKF